jgi:nucleotide-binding universal stress UspA family protein
MTGVAGQPALVVGVDGSAAARAALRWAVEQAQRAGGRVVAIAVVEPRPLIAPGSGLAGGAMTPGMVAGTLPEMSYGMADDEDVTAEADRWLSDAVSVLPAAAAEVVDPRAVVGGAADALLEAARGADLLVLGNHRRGTLTGALVGSVAQYCVQHATCPLVLVPAPESAVADDR